MTGTVVPAGYIVPPIVAGLPISPERAYAITVYAIKNELSILLNDIINILKSI